jgi:Leucine-rich repeat (LRR) protein
LNNKINTLTQKLNWPKLKHLILLGNQIESIPDNWGENTKNLNILNLSFNRIQSISSSFFEHVPLQHLMINNNELKELPATLGKEWPLMTIRLEHNQIKELPAPFGENWKNSLREIKFYNNPIQGPTDLKDRWPKLFS